MLGHAMIALTLLGGVTAPTGGGINPPTRKCSTVITVPHRVQVLRCVDGIKVYVWSHRYGGWVILTK